MAFRTLTLGKASGDFRFSNSTSVILYARRLKKVLDDYGLHCLYAPRCRHTTAIATEWRERADYWRVSTEFADGGIIDEPGSALAFFTADCPVLVVREVPDGRLAGLHCSTACLLPREGLSIVERLFSEQGFAAGKVQCQIIPGIGPCCYGGGNGSRVGGKIDVPPAVAECGPRVGQPSLNLPLLIRSQLTAVGVPAERIAAATTDDGHEYCTACADRKDANAPGRYHSHCWDGATDKPEGRNLVLAWFF